MENVKDHKGYCYNSTKEMCEHYGIRADTFLYRIRRGWTLEEALTKEADSSRRAKKCRDHLGNKYKNIKDMCKHYGISDIVFRTRIREGWRLEDALTKEVAVNNEKKCKDHLGNEYNSIREMLEHYGISREMYNRRISAGYTLEEALTMKSGATRVEKVCLDHLGNRYRSKAEMCRHYGVKVEAYDGRIKSGWSKKDALEKSNRNEQNCTDHLGKVYESTRSMCKSYNISYETYIDRLRRGMSKEDALCTPSRGRHQMCTDHLGNKYNSIKEMCDKYGIDYKVYSSRIKNGWDIRRALTTDVVTLGKGEAYDHLGNKYKDIGDMCKAYGISRETYRVRMNQGLGIEKTLTTPLKFNSKYFVMGEGWRTDKDIFYECSTRETRARDFISYSEILEIQKEDLRRKNMVNIETETELKKKYENFIQTAGGKEWVRQCREKAPSDVNAGDFGNYLYDFYTEMLQ